MNTDNKHSMTTRAKAYDKAYAEAFDEAFAKARQEKKMKKQEKDSETHLVLAMFTTTMSDLFGNIVSCKKELSKLFISNTCDGFFSEGADKKGSKSTLGAL